MKAGSHLAKEAWNSWVYNSVLLATWKEFAFASCLLHDIMYQMACWKIGQIPVEQPLFKLIVTAHSEKKCYFQMIDMNLKGCEKL